MESAISAAHMSVHLIWHFEPVIVAEGRQAFVPSLEFSVELVELRGCLLNRHYPAAKGPAVIRQGDLKMLINLYFLKIVSYFASRLPPVEPVDSVLLS